MKSSALIGTLFIVTSLPALSADLATGMLEIHEPWIREAPPMAKVLAGYLTLRNHSKKKQTINSFSSPLFDRIELHRTVIKNGMAGMSAVDKITVEPHDIIEFEPGGLHLMLINPKNRLVKGDKIKITLHLSDQTSLTFIAPVKKGVSNGASSDDHSHHGAMHH